MLSHPSVSRSKIAVQILLLSVVLAGNAAQAADIDLSTPAAKAATLTRLEKQWKAEKAAAEEWAARTRSKMTSVDADGNVRILARIDEDGLPEYWADTNVNAAISTGANLIRNTAPYHLTGVGVRIGVWEAGAIPRLTHQDFVGANLTVPAGQTTLRGTHATHVVGTIVGQGIHFYTVNAASIQLPGMAPSSIVTAYDATNDLTEMTAAGATTPNSLTGISLSNHSYAQISGWDYYDYDDGNGVVTYRAFYGPWGNSQSRYFGNYNSSARDWDTLARNAPYYLIVRSAGNDRGDAPPSNGASFIRFDSNDDPVLETYDSSIHPGKDGGDFGFDTIATRGVAKNILTVGASTDAVSGGLRSVAASTITSFSSYGPADDGRIKPDIVANGFQLYSMINNDTQIAAYSGTSMSGPNAAGSAVLLVEHWRNLLPATDMLSSTLKALIIHTADDRGNAGPDYAYGWGYMNAKAAADLITDHAGNPPLGHMREGSLAVSSEIDSYTFYSDGVSPIRATLCWIDPAGTATTIHNNSGARLVNNLELRIVSPSNATTMPFVLDWTNPSNPATTGANSRDNVEQVYISVPPELGVYTVTVSMTGSLSGGAQSYSLILSGQSPNPNTVTDFESYH